MLLTAFHALLRVGEFTVRSHSHQGPHTIQTSNCSVLFRAGAPHALQITIESCKHSKGRSFTLTIPSSQPPFCPVQAMHRYLAAAQPGEGPIFILPDRTPVTRTYFQSILSRLLRASNLDPDLYKSHSFRIGAASEAVTRLGLPEHAVRRRGRWSSDALKRYIRTPNFSIQY